VKEGEKLKGKSTPQSKRKVHLRREENGGGLEMEKQNAKDSFPRMRRRTSLDKARARLENRWKKKENNTSVGRVNRRPANTQDEKYQPLRKNSDKASFY